MKLKVYKTPAHLVQVELIYVVILEAFCLASAGNMPDNTRVHMTIPGVLSVGNLRIDTP